MANIGNVINIIRTINRIVNSKTYVQKLKKNCYRVLNYLACLSEFLERYRGIPLNNTATETLLKVRDAMIKTYNVIYTSYNHNYFYLMFNSSSLEKQIKEAFDMLTNHVNLLLVGLIDGNFPFSAEQIQTIDMHSSTSAPESAPFDAETEAITKILLRSMQKQKQE